MKTNNNFLFLVIFSVITFFSLFASCHDDGDTTKPVIDLIEPEEDAVLQIGDDVHFEMKVSDNEMLKSYKVEIHSNFDGHDHTTHSRTTETRDFSYEEIGDLSGKKNDYIDHHKIDIYEDATPGHYHLMVHCTDAAGNEAILTRDIELSHDGEEHHGEEHHDK